MTLPDVALFRWKLLLAVDQGADLGWSYGPWRRRQSRPAVQRRDVLGAPAVHPAASPSVGSVAGSGERR